MQPLLIGLSSTFHVISILKGYVVSSHLQKSPINLCIQCWQISHSTFVPSPKTEAYPPQKRIWWNSSISKASYTLSYSFPHTSHFTETISCIGFLTSLYLIIPYPLQHNEKLTRHQKPTAFGVWFRVKAPVTWRPPHRPVREDFPHTVPR